MFEFPLLYKAGISSLTKNRPGIEDLLRYGSMYADLLKVEIMQPFLGPMVV